MKNLRVTEELHDKLKVACANRKLKLQEAVERALTAWLAGGEAPDLPTPPKKEETVKPIEHTQYEEIIPQQPISDRYTRDYPNPLDHMDDHYLVRKTAKVGKPLKMMKEFRFDGFTWVLGEGCRPHFDADGHPIPVRFTDEDGAFYEIDEDEIKRLEEHFGLPVKFEK